MANNQFTTARERLLSKVEIVTESGCWIWMAHLGLYEKHFGSPVEYERRAMGQS